MLPVQSPFVVARGTSAGAAPGTPFGDTGGSHGHGSGCCRPGVLGAPGSTGPGHLRVRRGSPPTGATSGGFRLPARTSVPRVCAPVPRCPSRQRLPSLRDPQCCRAGRRFPGSSLPPAPGAAAPPARGGRCRRPRCPFPPTAAARAALGGGGSRGIRPRGLPRRGAAGAAAISRYRPCGRRAEAARRGGANAPGPAAGPPSLGTPRTLVPPQSAVPGAPPAAPPERTAAADGAGVTAGGGSSRRLTMALPRTLGELQLYRVLQRANLLGYYETFIQQGGDDVQQLCEAGEEEFLEIMALVGMATKPLHVRRLQKALREWASNPGLFSQPVSAVPVSSIPLFKLSEASGRKALSNGHASPGEAAGKGGGSTGTPPARSPTEPGEKLSPSAAPPWPGRSTPESEGGGDEEPGGPPFSPAGSGGEQPAGTEVLEPELVRTVAESVERLLQSCPRGGEAELRALMKLNKKLAKAVGHIFQLEDGDRHKEEEIRRHSAIYGRGEARRREGKQLTLHELIINEAAAQFCLRDNSLLLRRVELFSLSRQVARESTYLSSLKVARAHPEESGATVAKRLKQEAGEQSRPELLPLPVGPEPPGAAYRASLDEDTGSLSGESLDGHLQAAAACPRLTPPPGAAPDVPLGLPHHGLWSRHILQQTLMDEGLRLARLVSHERVGRLSPCLPGKPPGPEFEDGLAERGPPAPPEPPRGTIKVEQETSRQ